MASPSCRDDSSLELASERDTMLSTEKIHAYGRAPQTRWNRLCSFTSTLKWPVVLLLQFIILLRLYDPNQCPVEAGQDLNKIAPTLGRDWHGFSEQLEQFTPNYTSEASTLEVRDRWETLFPRGGGLVHVDRPEDYQYLGEPIKPVRQGEFGALFMVSWVHQLHCLAIMCNLDMTLEGAKPDAPAGTDGMGQTHVCRSHSQAVDWIESRRPWDSRDFIDLHEGGEV
ncbi:hypothetical protein DHEL01_v211370 [Diaporthe helianthi]|uniref:Uncharacterized protein n=1 Tax=Diaporthe helianthi TaxID=158607 RepID=A0A2P5HJ14_DIAHE|nr:hypothetical protein DHEL01_v211370 [Diaporthe helianthi]